MLKARAFPLSLSPLLSSALFGLLVSLPLAVHSSTLSVLTINIWNEGLGNQIFLKFPDADERLAEAILSANISTGIVGLAEVRGLASWGGRWLGNNQRSMQRLVTLLNKKEGSGKHLWHAAKQPNRLDVGLIFRNVVRNGEVSEDIKECEILWPSKEKSSIAEVWPLSWDRGSVGGWCLTVFGAPYFTAVAHLDWGGLSKEYYTSYLQGENKDSLFDGKVPIDATSTLSPVTKNALTKTLASLEAAKSDKVKQVETVLRWADELKAHKRIKGVMFMGDFNAPSHLDWTSDGNYTEERCTASTDFVRLHIRKCLQVEWPVTKVLADGILSDTSNASTTMSDAFRIRWPDVASNPGYTWPSFADAVGVGFGSIPYTTKLDEIDRIDYIMVDDALLGAGSSRWDVLDATVVGGPLYVTKRPFFRVGDGPDKTHQVSNLQSPEVAYLSEKAAYRWPSDHKAVLVTFAVEHGSTGDQNVVDGGNSAKAPTNNDRAEL